MKKLSIVVVHNMQSFISLVKSSTEAANEPLDNIPLFSLYYNYKIMFIPIDYLVNKLESLFKGIKPLDIRIGSDLNYRGNTGTPGKLLSISLYLDINLSNNTDKKISVKMTCVSIYPKKEISFLNFECEGIRKINPRSEYEKVFEIEHGDSLYNLDFKISGNRKREGRIPKTDIEKCKGIPLVFEIKYCVSPKYREKTFIFEMEDFFEKLLNLTQGKESKMLLFP